MFFCSPIRPIWVKCLAELIEPRLATLSRHVRGRPVLPLSLIALTIAEEQIALVAHWLTNSVAAKPDAIAEALIVSTRATVGALLRCKPDAPLLIAGEKIRLAHH